MFVIVLGVSGVGKTTVGEGLARQMNWPFLDADHFHPEANVQKMRQGIPLTEEDRKPWLAKLRETIGEYITNGKSGVLACSALRQSYRDVLAVNEEVKFVYLKGSYQLIEQRIRARRGHYMNPELLKSQFATLEEPHGDVIVVDVTPEPDEIVQNIRKKLAI